jgi:hypothetical protein
MMDLHPEDLPIAREQLQPGEIPNSEGDDRLPFVGCLPSPFGDPFDDDPTAMAQPTPETIADWLRLFIEPGQVTELRALHVPQRYGRPVTMAGFYDGAHLLEMAEEALRLTETARGVYFVLNPLVPDIRARCQYRTQPAESGSLAADQHVIRRRWLPVDVDPVRLAGISATDAEKAEARKLIQALCQHLRALEWPEPVAADSGNGYHALYPIDLATTDSGTVERCLAALADRFDTSTAKVDRSLFNPARIIKCPGTIAKKGDATADRPHRRSGIIHNAGAQSA